MQIAILGWGSLIWCPRNLRIKEHWYYDGPLLPIEFSRISRGGRLTLVLYPFADDIHTLWAYSAFEDLEEAKENLCEREETSHIKIGFVSIPDGKSNCQVVPQVSNRIFRWADKKGLEAVIWTDLSSNFEEKAEIEFNEDNVIKYLNNLTGVEQKEAEKYIRKTPSQVSTKIRHRIEEELGWKDS